MKNLHFILCIFVSLTCMTAVQSCIKDKIEEDPSKILLNMVSVDKPELDFVVIEDVKNFTITSRFSWKITAKELNGTDGGWYTISVVSGDGDDEINVTTKPNPTEALRTATLIITGRYNAVEVIISQAKDGEGMLNEDAITLADFNVIEAETQAFEIKSPFEWTITFKDKTTYSDPENPAIDPQWASVDVVDGEGDRKITVTVKDNKTGDKRIGEFTITAVGKTKIVIVNQIAVVYDMFDPEFFAWCIDPTKGNVDTDGDGSISAEEAEAVTIINCSFSALGSLKGVENFTELTELRCYSNKLTALNVSKNTKLTTFVCFYNNLGTLDVSKNTELTYLDCAFNDLTELDVSKNTELTKLSCIRNKLTALDVSKNTELTELVCYDNNLGTLDMSKNTKLTELVCYSSGLTALDVSKNTALTTLLCSNNGLTELDVSENTALTTLFCQNNPALAKINISGSSFGTLKDFQFFSIAPGAEIQVWDGFNPKDIPGGGKWVLPTTTPYYWRVPNLSYAFSTNFLDWCLNTPNNGIDTDGNGSISAEEAEAVTTIDCANLSLGSLKGIENFTKLTTLDCRNNNLTTLDVSKSTALTTLYCHNNNLTELDVIKNTALTTLACSNNKLTALDVSKNTALTTLVCSYNKLTALNVSENTALTTLWCYSNDLTTLDVRKNTALTELRCYNNKLAELDVSKNKALTYLACNSNPGLAKINISGSSFRTLISFSCYSIATGAEIQVWDRFNPKDIPGGYWDISSTTYWRVPNLSYAFSTNFLIWCLDPNNGIDTDGDSSISAAEAEAVTTIDCSNSSLGSLKGIENFTALTTLDCSNNNLFELDVSKNTELTELYCGENNLGTLDVSKNTKLTTLWCRSNNLTALDASKNTELTELVCNDNRNLTALDVSKNTKLTELYCLNNPNLAEINISGSSFGTLIKFNCTSIATGAKIYVWSGFNLANIPGTSTWTYPAGISWSPIP